MQSHPGWIIASLIAATASTSCNADKKPPPTSDTAGAASGAIAALGANGIPSCEDVILNQTFRKSVMSRIRPSVELFPDLGKKWERSQIDVCWENADASNPIETTHRNSIRHAIASSWEAASAVRFTGWGDCSASSDGVRIQIEDTKEGSHTNGLGTDLDGVAEGMVLNLTFKAWQPKCGTDEECIDRVAVHEFGHALGFAHEQNRPDEPDAECRKKQQGSKGSCTFCASDHDSVMSYCRTDWSGKGLLSTCDRYGVAALYGDP